MIQLNIAILEYIDSRNNIIPNGKSPTIIKKGIKRHEIKIRKLEAKLINRYPQFKQIILDFVSEHIDELSKERIDFCEHINEGEIHKFAEKWKMEAPERELLRKITFMSFCMGRNKAKDALKKFLTKGGDKVPFDPNKHKIDRDMKFLSRNDPHMRVELEKYIENGIDQSQEAYECKIERLHRPVEAILDDKAIVNLTDVHIAEDIMMGLSFGPKFCFPNKNDLDNKIMFIDYFIEHLELSFPVETHYESYKQLSIEMNKENRKERDVRNIWLNFVNYRIGKFKYEHPEICITKSDKGKHTVIMLNSDYIKKMDDLVVATDDYIRIDNIDIRELEEKNNEFVKVLTQRGTPFNEFCYDTCTTISQMYGLVKIHKKNFPVRPITAACASPGFKLAKLCTRILSEVFFEDGYHVRNSVQFVQKLKNIELDENEILVSFDVVSMFTNIPVDHMIILIAERKKEILKNLRLNLSYLGTF